MKNVVTQEDWETIDRAYVEYNKLFGVEPVQIYIYRDVPDTMTTGKFRRANMFDYGPDTVHRHPNIKANMVYAFGENMQNQVHIPLQSKPAVHAPTDVIKPLCYNHVPKKYLGLNESFTYCFICDERLGD